MWEPVIADDGHTYEKLALQRWCMQPETSPLSAALALSLIIPNLVLKNLIEQEQGFAEEQSPVAAAWSRLAARLMQ